MTNKNDTQQPPTFSLRSLLVATAFIAIFIGWSVDRAKLLHKQAELQSRLAGKERLEDPLERQFMTGTIVGKKLTDVPFLEVLADDTITPSVEYFQAAADYVTAPDVLKNTHGCKIIRFDLDLTGIARMEGVPSDFCVLVNDGTITHMRPGESLNL